MMRVWPRLPCRRAELLKFADDLEITFDIASAYQTVQFICYGSFLLWFLKLFAQQDWSATVTRTLIGSLGEASGWVLSLSRWCARWYALVAVPSGCPDIYLSRSCPH